MLTFEQNKGEEIMSKGGLAKTLMKTKVYFLKNPPLNL